MNLAFVTGADSKLFLNLCVLMDSFAAHMGDETLHVCDFGFQAPHRLFLQETARLLAPPPHLADEPQTWKHKASLFDFFAGSSAPPDAVVWFDADMVILEPVAEIIHRMAAELAAADKAAAVCTDSSGLDIAGFMAENEVPGVDLAPFRVLLDRHATNLATPYLNTGFFILRAGIMADTWRDETLRQPLFLLYEQNAFNALAGGPMHSVEILDPAIWNVHGELLGDSEIGGSAKILHTTSQGAHHTMSQVGIPIGGIEVGGNLKVFTRPDLMKIQGDHLMHFLLTHQELVAEVFA